jgi:hypothetical protein
MGELLQRDNDLGFRILQNVFQRRVRDHLSVAGDVGGAGLENAKYSDDHRNGPLHKQADSGPGTDAFDA